MRKLFGVLCLALLLAPVSLWGGAFTATTTGNISALGVNCAGGDTVTINTGVTLTVDTNCTVGTSGASGTAAITVNGTGELTLASGVTLTMQGDIQAQKGSTTTINGALVWNPPDGSTYKWIVLSTGSGTAHLVFGNGSTVSTTKQGTTGGNGWFDGGTNSYAMDLTFNGGVFTTCGGATQKCINAMVSNGQNVTANSGNAVRFIGAGEFYVRTASGTNNIMLDRIDFRSCADVSGSSNGNSCATVYSSVDATTGTRSLSRITAYNTTTKYINVGLRNAKVGSSVAAGDASDVPGIVAYNTGVMSNTANGINLEYKSMMLVAPSIDNINVYSLSNTTVRDSVFYAHKANAHVVVETATGALTQNFYLNNVCDGDNYFNTDAGDFVIAKRAATLSGNIAVNRCGTLFTVDNASSSLTAKNNTIYGSYAGSVGESGAGAGILQVFRNNLIVSPATDLSTERAGLWQPSAFVSQSSLSLDYNGFWDGTNGFAAGNLDYPVGHPLAGTNSYLGAASVQAWFTSGAFGDDGKGLHDINVDPQFKGCTSGGTTSADNCTLAKWDTNNGGAGTIASVGAEIVKLNGFDKDGNAATFNTNYSVSNALSYIREGFKVQNVALQNAGSPTDSSPTIGAMDYEAPAATMVPRRHTGQWQ